MNKVHPSEITPKSTYLSRREFLKGMGVVSASAMVLAACGGQPVSSTVFPTDTNTVFPTDTNLPTKVIASATPNQVEEPLTSFEAITNYNNYYEFTISKENVAKLSKDFSTSPWKIEVGGLVNNPKTYDLDDLNKFTQQERIYRLRCVEAWSMVIPWMGFPLADLLNEVEPTSSAKYVRFETIYDPDQMPGQNNNGYKWPYIEGLRIDEAMNDLTILATGLYGESLLPQSGAPVRLVVPWKYGFKSIKAIVKIDLVDEMPTSLWMTANPYEYGFYANVNPEVNHPRWSQSSERRIGESGRQSTLMFNGYEEEVAHLYAGMDLAVNY
ncbi:MAG: protein-methionine-sulfoxide reductase catalytic subunit MsrP [Anaerolineales bacterium]